MIRNLIGTWALAAIGSALMVMIAGYAIKKINDTWEGELFEYFVEYRLDKISKLGREKQESFIRDLEGLTRILGNTRQNMEELRFFLLNTIDKLLKLKENLDKSSNLIEYMKSKQKLQTHIDLFPQFYKQYLSSTDSSYFFYILNDDLTLQQSDSFRNSSPTTNFSGKFSSFQHVDNEHAMLNIKNEIREEIRKDFHERETYIENLEKKLILMLAKPEWQRWAELILYCLVGLGSAGTGIFGWLHYQNQRLETRRMKNSNPKLILPDRYI